MKPTASHLQLLRSFPFDPNLHRMRTASAYINIAGCGGLDWGSMVELQGPPSGGKSTYAYQSAECFLEDYGDLGEVLILDPENSANHLRLGKVFNLHINNHPSVRNPDPRVNLEFAPTYESAVEIVSRYIRRIKAEGKFLLIIWDSITMSKPKNEYESISATLKAQEDKPNSKEAKEGLGMKMNDKMLRPQIMKWAVNQIMTEMYRAPVIAFLINQATTQFTMFGAVEGSGGGYGFKHGIHYSLKFKKIKKIDGSSKLFSVGTLTRMSIEKSKVIPYLDNIEILIRDDQGGRIDSNMEIFKNSVTSGFIHAKNGGWYMVDPALVEQLLPTLTPEQIQALQEETGSTDFQFDKNRNMRDLADHAPSIAILEKAIERDLRANFQLLNWAYEELDLTLEDYKNRPVPAKKAAKAKAEA